MTYKSYTKISGIHDFSSLRNTADTVFLFSCARNISPPYTPGECHYNMGVLGLLREMLQNCYTFEISIVGSHSVTISTL